MRRPSRPLTSVTLPFGAAQKAGDLNAVIVGWNDATTHVSSLTDSKGNLYQLAVGPTVLKGSVPLTQAIYYAKNIAAAVAGANTVTLKFNAAAVYSRTSGFWNIAVWIHSVRWMSAQQRRAIAPPAAAARYSPKMPRTFWWEPTWSGQARRRPAAGWTRRMITNPEATTKSSLMPAAAHSALRAASTSAALAYFDLIHLLGT